MKLKIVNTKLGSERDITYVSLIDLEGVNSHLAIVNLIDKSLIIINVYMYFNPLGGLSQTEMFRYQL